MTVYAIAIRDGYATSRIIKIDINLKKCAPFISKNCSTMSYRKRKNLVNQVEAIILKQGNIRDWTE